MNSSSSGYLSHDTNVFRALRLPVGIVAITLPSLILADREEIKSGKNDHAFARVGAFGRVFGANTGRLTGQSAPRRLCVKSCSIR